MKKQLEILLVTLLMTSVAFAAPIKKKKKKVDCSDEKAVAEEAVAYSLLAAWESFGQRTCFKGEKFKYFKPELAKPEGEVTDASQFNYFDKKSDKYRVLGIRSQGNKRLIDVEFTLGTKVLKTTYTYLPDEEYQANTGICGYVVNDLHSIYRRDCVKL